VVTNKPTGAVIGNAFQSSYQAPNNSSNQFWTGLANNAIATSIESDLQKNASNKYYSSNSANANNVPNTFDYGASDYKSNFHTGLASEYNFASSENINNNVNNAQASRTYKYSSHTGSNYN
jgi:hypothetical protein